MDIMGKRVVLRAIEEQDKEMLLDLIQDPDITKVTVGYPQPVSYDHQIHRFRALSDSPDGLRRIIADKENPAAGLGVIILSNMDLKNKAAEIYIKLIRAARQKRYGQDAVNTLVAYVFCEFRLNCIYSHILEDNKISCRLFESCGFKRGSIQKSRELENGTYRNVCVYRIDHSDAEEEKT